MRHRPATFRPAVERLEDRLTPASATWTGLGANGNWSTGGNWDTGAAPGIAVGDVNSVATFVVLPAGRNTPVIGAGVTITLKQIVTNNYMVGNSRGWVALGGTIKITGNGVTSDWTAGDFIMSNGGVLEISNGTTFKFDGNNGVKRAAAGSHGTVYVTGDGSDLQFVGTALDSGVVQCDLVVGKSAAGTESDKGALDFLPADRTAIVFGDNATVSAYGGTVKVYQPASPTGPCGISETTGSNITLRAGATFSTVTTDASKTVDVLPLYIPANDTSTINLSGNVGFCVDTGDSSAYAIPASSGNVNFQLFNGSGVTLGWINVTGNVVLDGTANGTFYAAGTNDRATHTHTLGLKFTFNSSGTLSLGAAQSWVDVSETGTFTMNSGTLSFNTYWDGTRMNGDVVTANTANFNNGGAASANWLVNSNQWPAPPNGWEVIYSNYGGGAVPTSITAAAGSWAPAGGWKSSYVQGVGPEWKLDDQ